MHQARLTPTGTIFTVEQFEAQPEEWVATYRKHLSCAQCGGNGYYRRRSSNGQSACFGARHREGCDHAGDPVETVPAAQGETVPKRANRGEIIDLVLDGPFRITDPIQLPDATLASSKTRARRHEGPESETSNRRSMRLRRLLSNLTDNPLYLRDDPTRIIVPGRGEPYARDVLRSFADVAIADLNNLILLWGKVSTVNEPGELFLNSGRQGNNRAAIRIAPPAAKSLGANQSWTSARKSFEDGRSRLFAIALGELISMPSDPNNPDRFAVRVEDLQSFAFHEEKK